MFTKLFETAENPQITVKECSGDLIVTGADAVEVTVQVDDGDDSLRVAQEEDHLAFSTRGDCRITCPANATLILDAVRGDLKINEVRGDIIIGQVNGDARMHAIGALTAEQISGDLSAQDVDGNVRIHSVSSDARINKVNGNVTVQSIASDAHIFDVNGQVALASVGSDLKAGGIEQGLVAESVGSDVKLSPPFTAGANYVVRAGSDLTIYLPEEPNLSLSLQAGGGVRGKVAGLELHEEGGAMVGTLGEGAATIKAQVGGRVKVKGYGEKDDAPEGFNFDFDFSFLEGLGPMIEARVAEAMSGLDERIEEGLRYLNSEEFQANINMVAEKATRAAQRATERAREIAEREGERARRYAEHEAEKARMRAEHAERRWQRASGVTPPTPPTPPVAPTPPAPVADVAAPSADDKREERLQILRMVESGTLTAEQAANLLTALR
ncbi:MAG: hypothetical protein JXA21_26555 [Anaerolineae bacterium]|nr:hypothetical protein [Anaerolineae bacterium]